MYFLHICNMLIWILCVYFFLGVILLYFIFKEDFIGVSQRMAEFMLDTGESGTEELDTLGLLDFSIRIFLLVVWPLAVSLLIYINVVP